MENVVGAELTEFFISRDDAASGEQLQAIKFPEDCVIVSIQRGKRIVVPRGSTRLLPGDRVIALVGAGSLEAFIKALHVGEKEPSI
jgi:Trk K+ transport system NAD-binding subunit